MDDIGNVSLESHDDCSLNSLFIQSNQRGENKPGLDDLSVVGTISHIDPCSWEQTKNIAKMIYERKMPIEISQYAKSIFT